MEKRRAQELGQALNDQRGGKPDVIVLTPKEDNEEWWNLLGGKGPIAPAEAAGMMLVVEYCEFVGSDEDISVNNMKLYRLSDESGNLKFVLEHEGKPSRAKLNSKDVMILDAGVEIFVWIGKVSRLIV